jgi:hypothetical protein
LIPEMPSRHHKMQPRATTARPRRGLLVLIGAALAAISGVARGQGFAGAVFSPEEATACIRVESPSEHAAWVELALDAIELAEAPIRPGWETCRRLRSRLAPDAAEAFHAIGPGGRHWIHAVRWSDPIAVEFGLQRLGSRPMGAGRFRLPALGLEIAIAGEWLLIGPNACPWLDQAVDKATLEALDRIAPEVTVLVGDLARGPVELILRHEAPIGGLSAIGIRPTSDTHALIDFAGRYAASPLPIRTAGEVDMELASAFDGRVAFATIEAGVGLLDPLMVRHAATHPEIVPAAELRRRFAAQRLVVLDGEPVRIDPIGIIEVPAACVAIPMREHRPGDSSMAELTEGIDRWIESAGRAVRATWNQETSGPVRTRGDDIRHLLLTPGLLQASGGHPLAVNASLNWTLHTGSEGAGWLVAGTSPGLVRRVTATLDERRSPSRSAMLTGAGVASPARIALQITELAQLRGIAGDPDAEADAEALSAAASMLDRFERISWRMTRQDERLVRGTAELRLVPGVTGTSGPRAR